MTIKTKDFIELDFTGKIKDDNIVFDTTDPKIAEEAGLGEGKYVPIIVCVGQGQLIKGLDEFVLDKEPGKYHVDVPVEAAYGKKDAKLIKMIPTTQFTKHNIKPEVGLQVNIDGLMGIVRTVTGGRTVVDFNHPLSGKDLSYDLEILRKVEDKKEQVNALLKLLVNVDGKIEIKDKKVEIKITYDIPEEVQQKLKETIKELTELDAEFITETPKQEEKKTLLKHNKL